LPNKLPKHIELKPLPFEEAIEAFKGTVPMTPEGFYALADEARAAAFMVSGVTRMDILVDFHNAVGKAITDGETLADFRNRVDNIFEARGWSAPVDMTPWRLETIFRTNVQTAYQTGRYKQMVDQKDAFPYWEYDAVNDSRTRPSHAALDGKIFAADHPFWDTWYPPNGYNCRCGVNPVHKYEAEGLEIETEDPTGGLIEPIDPVTGNKMPARPLIPDPGWGHNPAKSRWQPDLNKYPNELAKQFRVVKNLDVGGGHTFPGVVDEIRGDVTIYRDVGLDPDDARYIKMKNGIGKDIDRITSKVPPEHRKLREIRIWDREDPDNAYFAKKYHIPSFKAAASAGRDEINFYKGSLDGPVSSVRGYFAHEYGHIYAHSAYGWAGAPQEWDDLTKKEGWVSSYSKASKMLSENFADTFKLFLAGSWQLDTFKLKKAFIKTLLGRG